jgi:hypothetical protein
MLSTWNDYQEYNTNIKLAWKKFSEKLLTKINFHHKFPNATFVLTGSCAQNLAYPPPAGDVDCAFVATDLKTLESIRKHVVECIQNSDLFASSARYPVGFEAKTKAGLYWLPISNVQIEEFKDVKLDVTFRTTAQHECIEKFVESAVLKRFPTEESKFSYVCEQHDLANRKLKFDETSKPYKTLDKRYRENRKWFIEGLVIPLAI